MNIALIIIAIISLIFIIFIVAYIMKSLKGKINIELNKFEYMPGDTISGATILKLRKDVEAKALNIGLIGEQVSISRTSKGNKRKTNTIFNFKKPLDGEKIYAQGEKRYEFSLKIPSDLSTKLSTGNAVADSLIKSVSILTGNNSQIRWYVTAELETSGLNLIKHVQINIG